MKDAEHRLQIVLKTGLLGLLLLLGGSLQAANSNEAEPAPPEGLIQETGHVEGYMPLPVGETLVDATFLSDKLGVAYGKVLILHDADGGIDGHGLVRTLRFSLSESGWSTMTVALQYPVSPQIYLSTDEASAADETISDNEEAVTADAGESQPEDETGQATQPEPDNNARVGAALAYLNARQPGPTVLIAIGRAAQLTDVVINQLGDEPGLVWIAPEITLPDVPEVTPILDIVAVMPGARNHQAVNRKKLMRQNQVEGYSQRIISGAGYGFYGFENNVLGYVRGWLSKHFVEEAES